MLYTQSGSGPASPDPDPALNCLLRTLDREARNRLYPHLEYCDLPLGKNLYQAGIQQRYAWFPVDSLVSLLVYLQNGDSAEIAVVGNEGVVGFASFLGGDTTASEAVVQGAGTAYRVRASVLQSEFQRNGQLAHTLLRYSQSLITQMAQTAACNRHHSIVQQLSRWLLMSADRMHSEELRMTHELIANMLGVRREGVTEAAGRLQECGAINYRRGRIVITDRALLEEKSCECYEVIRSEYHRLLPVDCGAKDPAPR